MELNFFHRIDSLKSVKTEVGWGLLNSYFYFLKILHEYYKNYSYFQIPKIQNHHFIHFCPFSRRIG